jgi:hypothetical protein
MNISSCVSFASALGEGYNAEKTVAAFVVIISSILNIAIIAVLSDSSSGKAGLTKVRILQVSESAFYYFFLLVLIVAYGVPLDSIGNYSLIWIIYVFASKALKNHYMPPEVPSAGSAALYESTCRNLMNAIYKKMYGFDIKITGKHVIKIEEQDLYIILTETCAFFISVFDLYNKISGKPFEEVKNLRKEYVKCAVEDINLQVSKNTARSDIEYSDIFKLRFENYNRILNNSNLFVGHSLRNIIQEQEIHKYNNELQSRLYLAYTDFIYFYLIFKKIHSVDDIQRYIASNINSDNNHSWFITFLLETVQNSSKELFDGQNL